MPHKIKLILNPVANHGRSVKTAEALRSITTEYNVDWSDTQYAGHAVELARQAGEQGFDLVLAVGGDGTVHEVINGLMQVPEKKRPALGIIPLGSGNDFAHILGLPENPVQAIRSGVEGQFHPLDVVQVRDQDGRQEYFNNTLGIGFDGVVTIRTRKITWVHGFMMYFVAVLQTILMNFKPMNLHVETDQETWDMPVLMLTLGNGPREGGGFSVTPEAKYDDGILNYCTVRKIPRLTMFRLIPEFMNGTHARFAPVKIGACRKMAVSCDKPLYIHCDGEIFAGFDSTVRKLAVEIIPGAIRYIK